MGQLNKDAYVIKGECLVYDGKHPLDARNIVVTITPDADGVIARGQVIDVADDTYTPHATSGSPCCIVAESVAYTSDDTQLTVPCYISGTFYTGALLATPALTNADIETLRGRGIILK